MENVDLIRILDKLYKDNKDGVEEWVRDKVVPELEEYQHCEGCCQVW